MQIINPFSKKKHLEISSIVAILFDPTLKFSETAGSENDLATFKIIHLGSHLKLFICWEAEELQVCVRAYRSTVSCICLLSLCDTIAHNFWDTTTLLLSDVLI